MNGNTINLYYSEMSSPMGQLVLVKSRYGMCYLEYGTWDSQREIITRWTRRWMNQELITKNEELFSIEKHQLTQYFQKERTLFSLQLDLRGTEFQLKVWQALLRISYGTTASYQDIARQIQSPKAMRAVGAANHRNPLPLFVPCHRIIGHHGALVGYDGGLAIKKWLLHLEQHE
jgi:O-6-methylguanine DNA methyltransferase